MLRTALTPVCCGLIWLGLPACTSPTRSQPAPDFADMAIHYTRTSGWADAATLESDGTGLVRASRLGHATLDTVVSVSTRLGPAARDRLAALFTGFGDYRRRYEPDPWYTDGTLHTIRVTWSDRADTVSVYEPGRAAAPVGLRRLIAELESLWQDMVYPRD